MRKASKTSPSLQLSEDRKSAAKRMRRTGSSLAKEPVKQSQFRERLEVLRRAARPAARSAGFFADEDLFRAIS